MALLKALMSGDITGRTSRRQLLVSEFSSRNPPHVLGKEIATANGLFEDRSIDALLQRQQNTKSHGSVQ